MSKAPSAHNHHRKVLRIFLYWGEFMKMRKKWEASSKEEEYHFIEEKIKRKPIEWRRIMGRILVVFGLGVVFGAAACFTMEFLRPTFIEWTRKDSENHSLNVEQGENHQNEVLPPEELPGTESTVAAELQRVEAGIYQIAEEAKPFVVDVMGIREEPDWFEEIYATENQTTGVIISMDSQVLILANRGAIKSANYIHIRFCDGTVVQGHEIAYDGPTKLSVIQVDEELSEETRKAIKVATFNGEEVLQGDLVITIGRPLGQYNSVVYGHISGQTVKKYTDALYRRIFTDIPAATEGQGVLINAQGQVLGLMNQSLADEGSENLITALGTRETQKLVEKLMGGENPGYFGIEGETFSSDKAGIKYKGTGIYVTRVKKDFPAMTAGIQSGDILTEVGGQKVEDMVEFQSAILKYNIGDKVPVTLMRMGKGEYKEMTFEVELGGN